MNEHASRAATHDAARVARLRAAMRDAGVDACIVPSSDPHLSEYPPLHWQARAWLSGFTGSVGTLVVTASFAGVWVDSRYWVQAEAELDGTGVELMKLLPGSPAAHVDWLVAHLAPGAVLAVDGRVLALAAADALAAALTARGIALRTDLDLPAAVWTDRPPLPVQAVFEHGAPFAPLARADKLAAVRRAMAGHSADQHLLSTLDDIAWLFNLRGADVNYNPVFVAHALVGPERATLFVDAEKVPAPVRRALAADGVDLAAYATVPAALAALPPGTRLLVDPRRMTHGLVGALHARGNGDGGQRAAGQGDGEHGGVADGPPTLVQAPNPSTLAKACKTAAEIANVRETMEQDGAALCEFFVWLEAQLAAGAPDLTELSVDTQLHATRARRPNFVSESFGTIAGFNANGAMPHYRATREAHAAITGDGLLLIDSGGQYLGGTTDITRVVPVGTPSLAQKHDFTTVLQGMIALSAARFPRGIRSPMLDAIARAPLWAQGLDYGHGTGHGVGYFLNVHEGPQVISHHAPPDAVTAMEEGMITSIEPGVYRAGQWGVRIENLVVNRRVADAGGDAGDFGEFLDFETLTLCPIDTRCIVAERLTPHERQWLNAYHATVRARLSRWVEGEARVWLEARTQPL
ncbi:aminopeptidase family protein P [Robbsia sp. Bb-Pol-6]|uniref:Aminopeptidase family protein P n=1 Tax=Robbsia betulipollinis TaxID=2981849 RepID=A0ABT3ZNV1_9BURK|nr:aminopeptidase P family protein [Robbsia betulipollinis]MCY0388223.1 aminopeptidase family protein P [Robbsia betulipollinis]